MTLSASDKQAVYSLAGALQVKDPQWLFDLIHFESGSDPKASNPLSSAKGLIQFIDSTARDLGYANSQDLINKHPTIPSQLEGPVYAYLSPYAPFNTEASLYLSVFFPAARNYDPNTSFSTIFNNLYGSSGPTKYAAFKKANPNILTPQDYINYVKKKPITRLAVKGGIGIIGIGLLYLLYRAFK